MRDTLTTEAARAEATVLLRRDRGAISLRSCWRCNAAHEHLRDADLTTYVIACFGCCHYFYRGVDITEDDDE